MNLWIRNSSGFIDITDYAMPLTWSGRRGAAGRTLQFTAADYVGYGTSNLPINVPDGVDAVLFDDTSSELFRGRIWTDGKSQAPNRIFNARDSMFYLAQNDGWLVHAKKRLDQIFVDICTRYQLKFETPPNTSYQIPKISKTPGKLWDALTEAMSLTYKQTGVRWYIDDVKGVLILKKRIEDVIDMEFEESIITAFSYETSAESLRTRISLINNKGKVLGQATDADREKIWGILQTMDQPDDKKGAASVKEQASTLLKNADIDVTFSISVAIDRQDAISGRMAHVTIVSRGIEGFFYIEEDSHRYDGQVKSMTLSLTKHKEDEAA